MSSDIVKRLRAGNTLDIGEAADRIEALEGEVERLTVNGIHTCHDNCQRLPCVQGREIRALKHDIARHMEIANAAEARAEQLEGEVKKLSLSLLTAQGQAWDNHERAERLRVALTALIEQADRCESWVRHTDAFEDACRELENKDGR